MTSIDLSGYKLTFDDEFNTRSISQTGAGTTWADIRSEWRYDANSDIGFGHSSFVDSASGYDPFSVQNGALTITAVPDRTSSGYPGSWESGLITTQGNFSQTYGYFEIRADFSKLAGAWDAFWLLPDQQTPDPNNAGGWQELDAVEHYGANDAGVYSTIHTTDPQNGIAWQENRQVYSEMSNPSGYHTYGVDWEADQIKFYVDGQLVGSQATPSDMHSAMYILADLATQSDASGNSISSSIDYIRAYSSDPNAVAVVQDTVSSPDGQDPGLYGAVSGSSIATSADNAASTSSDAHASEIARLYYGLLDRAPDAGGLQSWTNAITSGGMSLHDVAQAMLSSAEYASDTGAVTDSTYVQDLYQQVLDRAAEASGLQAWTSALASGADRSSVAQAFVDSSEYQGHYAGQSNAAYVEGLYEHVLGRTGDAAGLQAWSSALDSNATTRVDVANSIVHAAEFQSHLSQLAGGQSDSAFVESLYENALGRQADAGGLQAWTDALAHGTSRTDVAVGIAESTEAQQHLAALVQQSYHLA
ncbi:MULTISPECIES: DUF4214 domain-containing protein [unclassified Methylobacterium]|uniref:DUF4214 domain-containing protein n=1 Tax=unclassified Methylobacterium TaxID=2615210 RepID=UPI002269FC38|nr:MULTISPECIES: DUF4214 domain-containing protein [unclassified Methylobacterium]